MEQENQTNKGHIHPISQMIAEINRIFSEMGFEVADGPELETEFYNFDALNIPADHPARDMWDTFLVKPRALGKLMRTHTSPVQARYMEKHKPPFAIIVPGKVFRYEATDATHEAQFHQVEGLMVGKDISLANLKWVLAEFFEKFFGKKIDIRFRPSFFPFVEPGVEIDMSCFKCNVGGKSENPGFQNGAPSGADSEIGCGICKKTGWIEIMGAGMVHPKVLENAGVDSREFSGFAFGVGIDRLAMLKYGVDDVRLFYSGDLRLVEQF
jgi:phenylalanyl-tRNA synthetase alpha chain